MAKPILIRTYKVKFNLFSVSIEKTFLMAGIIFILSLNITIVTKSFIISPIKAQIIIKRINNRIAGNTAVKILKKPGDAFSLNAPMPDKDIKPRKIIRAIMQIIKTKI